MCAAKLSSCIRVPGRALGRLTLHKRVRPPFLTCVFGRLTLEQLLKAHPRNTRLARGAEAAVQKSAGSKRDSQRCCPLRSGHHCPSSPALTNVCRMRPPDPAERRVSCRSSPRGSCPACRPACPAYLPSATTPFLLSGALSWIDFFSPLFQWVMVVAKLHETFLVPRTSASARSCRRGRRVFRFALNVLNCETWMAALLEHALLWGFLYFLLAVSAKNTPKAAFSQWLGISHFRWKQCKSRVKKKYSISG